MPNDAVRPNVAVRPDLVAAQQAAWRQVTSPGASFSGAQRWAIAAVALAALDDTEPLAPWVSPTQAGRTPSLLASAAAGVVLPDVVVDATYRIARHAATLTDAWYRDVLARGIDPVAYVELVGVVCVVAAVDGFYRAIGMQRPPLPAPTDGVPHGQHPQVEPATLNWVLVAAPADQVASVVQGLSAAPAELDNVKRLAAVQYIPFDEMGDLSWNRGTLSRGETELVAARLSSARECFF
jgi:hypothetical protein